MATKDVPLTVAPEKLGLEKSGSSAVDWDVEYKAGDTSSSDEEHELTKKHKLSRTHRLPTPWLVPTFFVINTGQLSDGTNVADETDVVVEHTYSLTFIQKLHVTLEYPSASQLGFWYGVFMQLVILLNVVSGVVASSPDFFYQPPSPCVDSNGATLEIACNKDASLCPDVIVCAPETLPILETIDFACFIIFAIDYLLRFVTSVFSPPRIAQLLHEEWDRGEIELQRQTKRAHYSEAIKSLKQHLPPLPQTEENVRPLIYAKLTQLDHFKNGSEFYCCCGFYKKLNVVIMNNMGRDHKTSVHQLGMRQLLEFYESLQRYESDFTNEFRRQRGWCGDLSKRDDDEFEDDPTCSSCGDSCKPQKSCVSASSRGCCIKNSKGGDACLPNSSVNDSDDDEVDDDPNPDGTPSSKTGAVHPEFDDINKSWASGMKQLEEARPTQSFFTCSPIRNRLSLREAWMMEVEHHFLAICDHNNLNPEEVAPSCRYEDERPRSDPDWPLHKRAVQFIFSFQNMIDFAAVVPLFLMNVSNGGSSLVSTTFLRVIRCVRLLRVIKLNSYSAATLYLLRKTMVNSAETLLYLMVVAVIIGILFAFIMHQLEAGTYRPMLNSDDVIVTAFYRRNLADSDYEVSPFRSVSVSLYYVFVTMTTLGYGDMYPTSIGGRALASLIAFSGVLFIALPTSVVSTNFSEEYAKYKKRREGLMREKRQLDLYALQKDKARSRKKGNIATQFLAFKPQSLNVKNLRRAVNEFGEDARATANRLSKHTLNAVLWSNSDISDNVDNSEGESSSNRARVTRRGSGRAEILRRTKSMRGGTSDKGAPQGQGQGQGRKREDSLPTKRESASMSEGAGGGEPDGFAALNSAVDAITASPVRCEPLREPWHTVRPRPGEREQKRDRAKPNHPHHLIRSISGLDARCQTSSMESAGACVGGGETSPSFSAASVESDITTRASVKALRPRSRPNSPTAPSPQKDLEDILADVAACRAQSDETYDRAMHKLQGVLSRLSRET